MLIEMIGVRLQEMKKAGAYGGSFSALGHFFGYEGRCAFPSNFDSDYCYSLGYNAFLLIAYGCKRLHLLCHHLTAPAAEWKAGVYPSP